MFLRTRGAKAAFDVPSPAAGAAAGAASGTGPALPPPGAAGPFPLRVHGRWHLGALAGLLAYATFQSGLWTGDLGERLYLGPDPAICGWLQTTVAGNLLQHPWRLFEGNVYYPQPHPVVYANAQVGSALLVSPVRLFTANPILLDNLGTLLSLLAASYALFLLAWWLWGDPGAALVPAIAVTYAQHQIHHLTHLNMLCIFGFPLLLLGLFRLFEGAGLGATLLAAAGLAVSALSCAYYGVAAALLAAAVGLVGLGQLLRRRTLAHALAAGGLAALACWPYLEAFRSASLQGWAEGGPGGGGIALRLPQDLVRTNAYLWSGVLAERGDSAFAGFAVLALAGWGAWRARGRFHVRVLAAVGALFLLLSLGGQLSVAGDLWTLPYGWLERAVPLLGAGRHPVSFVVVYLVAVGLLAALGARLVGARAGSRRLPVLLGVVVLEVLSPAPRRETRPELPPVYAEVARLEPEGAIVELPFDSSEQQLWAALHGLQTASGMLPHAPPEWLNLAQWFHEDLKLRPARDVSDRRSLIFLRARFPVRYLIAHPGTSPAWIANIEATPSVFEPVLESGGARVYRISRSGRGRRLRRDYRSEDVVDGLDLSVSGPAGHVLVIREGEAQAELARVDLRPEPRALRLRLPERPRRRLVSLDLRPEPEAEFELLRIEPVGAR